MVGEPRQRRAVGGEEHVGDLLAQQPDLGRGHPVQIRETLGFATEQPG